MPGFSSNAARAADILIALGDAGPSGASLKALHERLGDSKPALHRALSALAMRGFVENAGSRGTYRIGPAVDALARRSNATSRRLEILRPVLYDVVAATGFAAFLMAEAGLDAVCLEMVSNWPVQSLTGGTGGRVPLGIAAGSLAILASLPPSSRNGIMANNAERYARFPALRPMTASRVAEMVEQTLIDGFSNDYGNYFPNEGGIGILVPSRGIGSSGLAIGVSVVGESASAARLTQLARQVSDILARHQVAL